MQRGFLKRGMLVLFVCMMMVIATLVPLLASVDAQVRQIGSPIYSVGLFRPRIDGFLEPGLPGTISEWDDDSATEQIKLVAKDGSILAGDLKVKSIGTDFYFALDVESVNQPDVLLVLDLDADNQGDHMVASIGGRSADLIVRQGKWESVTENATTIGQAVIAPSEQANHWITEMEHIGLPAGPDISQIGWNLVLVDPITRKSYWFPDPFPEPECPVPEDPFEFPPPPIDLSCFQPQMFRYEIDPKILVLLQPVSVSIDHIEVTQAIQTEDQGMPLVLGKTSMARVYVDTGGFALDVEVTLSGWVIEFRLLDGFGWLTYRSLGSMTRTFVAPADPQRENLADSANFVLPTEWTQVPSLSLQAGVRALNGVTVQVLQPIIPFLFERNSFRFEETHDLVTYIIPINEAGSLPTAATIQSWTENLTAVYPMANPSYPSYGTDPLGPWTGTDGELLVELTKLVYEIVGQIQIATLQGEPIPYEFPDQIFGARRLGGGLSDPIWIGGDSFATFGGPTGTSRELIMAHEIQHNIGPGGTNGYYGLHIGGCGAGADDLDWTALYGTNDFSIHDLGWTPNVANPETNQQALVPADYPDFMSYCQSEDLPGVPAGTVPTKWISTYRWPLLMDRLQNWQLGSPGLLVSPLLEGLPTVRIIHGVIPLTGTPTLEPTYEIAGIVPIGYVPSRATSDKYTAKVVMKDGLGTVTETIYIDPVFVNSEGFPRDEYHFVYLVSDNGNIATVELVDNLDNVTQSYASIEDPELTFLSVPSSFQRGVGETVSWSAIAPNSPFLEYQLEYSPDNRTWFRVGQSTFQNETQVTFVGLPGSTEGRLRLRATNGLDTAYAISPSFSLPNQLPSITVSGSALQQSARSRLSFRALVSDPDMGRVDSSSIVWTLNGREMDRGEIVSFSIALAGNHTLKAEYTDSAGAMAEKSVTLDITSRPFPTTEELEEFKTALILEDEEPPPPPWVVIIVSVILVAVAVLAVLVWYIRKAR